MRIIPQGRAFISRLLTLAHSAEKLSDQIQLDEGCLSDITFWKRLLNDWNGISFFYNDDFESSLQLQLFTDAAPSIGFGGFFQEQWFAEKWPNDFPKTASDFVSSALYELYPIAVASVIWGPQWSRKRITMLCDNEATVAIINKGRSSCNTIMPFVRRLIWQSVVFNFIIKAEHIPGRCNVIADSLSRFRFQTFRQLCPSANPDPATCPPLADMILN